MVENRKAVKVLTKALLDDPRTSGMHTGHRLHPDSAAEIAQKALNLLTPLIHLEVKERLEGIVAELREAAASKRDDAQRCERVQAGGERLGEGLGLDLAADWLDKAFLAALAPVSSEPEEGSDA